MKKSILKLTALIGVVLFVSCGKNSAKETEISTKNSVVPDSIINNTIKIVLKSEVEWTFLNPKRKDKAPMAGTLWGDRDGLEATGFLLKPFDGFSSPPHIHNVSYRGIVLNGELHNDDPTAENMWMPAGSFWTQPKGEVHITSAKGSDALAYIEIEQGPYHVLPLEEAFDSGERPINIDKSNIVWVESTHLNWIKQANTTSKVAFLWGEYQENTLSGTLLKLPTGFKGTIYSKGLIFGAVVISGKLMYNSSEIKTLEVGSYFSSKGEALHSISTLDTETVLYIRTNNTYNIELKK